MNIFKIVVMFLCMVLLASCATTYMRAKSPNGEGYYDTLLQQGMYEINFNGNDGTDPTTAQDFALLRAAETCLENGYKTFDIIKSEDKSQTEIGSMPIYGYYNTTTLVFSATEPKIMLIIKCSKDSDLTFVAEEIRVNLRKKHNLDK
jgi:hypothetical protein